LSAMIEDQTEEDQTEELARNLISRNGKQAAI
jgi:hypothetical protein